MKWELAVTQERVKVKAGHKPGFVVLRLEEHWPGGAAIELEMTPGQTRVLMAKLRDAASGAEVNPA